MTGDFITGNLNVRGDISANNISLTALKSDLDGFNDDLKNLTTSNINILKNIDQNLNTTANPTFNYMTTTRILGKTLLMTNLYPNTVIYAGTAVCISGKYALNKVAISSASNLSSTNYKFAGIATTSMSPGYCGNIVISGYLACESGTFAENDKLYLGDAGAIVNVRPTTGRTIEIGMMIEASQTAGLMYIYPSPIYSPMIYYTSLSTAFLYPANSAWGDILTMTLSAGRYLITWGGRFNVLSNSCLISVRNKADNGQIWRLTDSTNSIGSAYMSSCAIINVSSNMTIALSGRSDTGSTTAVMCYYNWSPNITDPDGGCYLMATEI